VWKGCRDAATAFDRGSGSDALVEIVKASNNDSVIAAFDVEQESPAGVVVNVTPLFTTNVQDISPMKAIGGTTFDRARTFVDRVGVFERNVEVDVTATYGRRPASAGQPASAASASAPQHASLPENLMPATRYDDRVITHRFAWSSARLPALESSEISFGNA
jgi:hypothetical protein